MTAALPLRVVVGALMGASINAALRQQEKPYNRPDGRGNAIPLWWLTPSPCPVGSMSLDSRVAELPYESSSFATPASGGIITRAYCRAIYEESVSRCFILPPEQGEVRRSPDRGVASVASQSAELFSCPMTQKSKSRNADFISIAAERQSATFSAAGAVAP